MTALGPSKGCRPVTSRARASPSVALFIRYYAGCSVGGCTFSQKQDEMAATLDDVGCK